MSVVDLVSSEDEVECVKKGASSQSFKTLKVPFEFQLSQLRVFNECERNEARHSESLTERFESYQDYELKPVQDWLLRFKDAENEESCDDFVHRIACSVDDRKGRGVDELFTSTEELIWTYATDEKFTRSCVDAMKKIQKKRLRAEEVMKDCLLKYYKSMYCIFDCLVVSC